MKKKLIKIVSSFLILCLIILAVTKPSPNTFNEWLMNKYDIECKGKECISNSKKYKVVSKETENYFLFTKVGAELESEEGGFKYIEGIGILGGFIPFTYKPYYEKE